MIASAPDDDAEIESLLEAVERRYGYDFRHYARPSLRRRIRHRASSLGLQRIADLRASLLADEHSFADFVSSIAVHVTEMFRDPAFFRALREHVVPMLRTYPFFNVWHAGCATGEEVYSFAIVLEEEGIYDRARIYATDLEASALAHAREAIYPLKELRAYTESYRAAGGKGAFSDYYHSSSDWAKLDGSLGRRITFARHNLVTDAVFAETQLIVCRNVLIYFDRTLQERAVALFHESLCPGGFLGLGSQETLRFLPSAARFDTTRETERIYRKRSRA